MAGAVPIHDAASWAALGPQLTPFGGVALVALRIAALGGFGPSQARPQQAPLDGAALVALVETSVAALAALDPQLTPDGAALVTSVAQGCWSGWQDSGQVSG